MENNPVQSCPCTVHVKAPKKEFIKIKFIFFQEFKNKNMETNFQNCFYSLMANKNQRNIVLTPCNGFLIWSLLTRRKWMQAP